jgi:hypothetical protein
LPATTVAATEAGAVRTLHRAPTCTVSFQSANQTTRPNVTFSNPNRGGAAMSDAEKWDGIDRRSHPRLRTIIASLQERDRQNQEAIAIVSQELFHLREQIDRMRKAG